MVTVPEATVPYVHPVRVGGRARALWATRVAVDVVATTSLLATVWFGALWLHEPTSGTFLRSASSMVASLVLAYVRRWLLWHIATHVPGGIRVGVFGDPAIVWTMTYRSAMPELVVRGGQAAVMAAAAVLIVAAGPAPEAAQVVAVGGGALLGVTILNVITHWVRAARSSVRSVSDTWVRSTFLALNTFVALAWTLAGATDVALVVALIAGAADGLWRLARWTWCGYAAASR